MIREKEAEINGQSSRSSESPLHSSSSIFLVIILVTSCRSSFSLSKLEDAAFAVRVSRYSRAVFDINVSVNSYYSA